MYRTVGGGRVYKTVGWGEGALNSRVGVGGGGVQNRCTNYSILIQNSQIKQYLIEL